MTFETAAEGEVPDPSALVALAFLAPWALVSVFLPAPWRMAAFGLVTLLGVLLLAAAAWSFQTARARGLDAPHWAFVTVLSFGFAMAPLAFRRARGTSMTYVCSACGREGPLAETFCHGCGAQ